MNEHNRVIGIALNSAPKFGIVNVLVTPPCVGRATVGDDGKATVHLFEPWRTEFERYRVAEGDGADEPTIVAREPPP